MIFEFNGFPKIVRLSREIIITEKIDGTQRGYGLPERRVSLVNVQRWALRDQDVLPPCCVEWVFADGDPESHGMRCCPVCGGRLVVEQDGTT